MQTRIPPASRGWYWVLDAYLLHRKGKLRLSLIVMAYWMLMGLLGAIPWVGQIVATLAIPAMSVSLMNACRLIEQGKPLPASVLFSGFTENRRTLLILGVIYLLLAFFIFAVTIPLDGGALFSVFVTGQRNREVPVDNQEIMLSAQVTLALFIPLVMAYWYAPVLAAWHRLSAGKALFFSFFACLHSWRAFLTYSVAAALAFIIPGLMLGLINSAAAGSGLFSMLGLMFILFFILPTLYASFYISYRDVFTSIDENA